MGLLTPLLDNLSDATGSAPESHQYGSDHLWLSKGWIQISKRTISLQPKRSNQEHAKRNQHTAEMLAGKRLDSCFKGLAIFKACIGLNGKIQMVGYITTSQVPVKTIHTCQ